MQWQGKAEAEAKGRAEPSKATASAITTRHPSVLLVTVYGSLHTLHDSYGNRYIPDETNPSRLSLQR
jgi:hypothetical protein